MLKRKICITIILFISLFICEHVSASSIDYQLQINTDKKCYETITYTIEKNNSNSHLKDILNNNIYFNYNSKNIYNKSVTSNGNNNIVVLKTNYNCSDIKYSKFLKECFKESSYKDDNYKIDFYANEPFSCTNRADSLKVTVITNIPVILHNADDIIGNQYIWNKIDKSFFIDLSLGEFSPNSDVLAPVKGDYDIVPTDDMDEWPVQDVREVSYTPYIVGGTIVILLAGGFVYFKYKRKNSSNLSDF